MMPYEGKKRKKVVSPTNKRKSVNGSFQSHSRVHRNPTGRLREDESKWRNRRAKKEREKKKGRRE